MQCQSPTQSPRASLAAGGRYDELWATGIFTTGILWFRFLVYTSPLLHYTANKSRAQSFQPSWSAGGRQEETGV